MTIETNCPTCGGAVLLRGGTLPGSTHWYEAVKDARVTVEARGMCGRKG
jgi:hypothetical protein